MRNDRNPSARHSINLADVSMLMQHSASRVINAVNDKVRQIKKLLPFPKTFRSSRISFRAIVVRKPSAYIMTVKYCNCMNNV